MINCLFIYLFIYLFIDSFVTQSSLQLFLHFIYLFSYFFCLFYLFVKPSAALCGGGATTSGGAAPARSKTVRLAPSFFTQNIFHTHTHTHTLSLSLSLSLTHTLTHTRTTGKPHDWFHGVITRREAERLLTHKPIGCYMVRVSESRFGYSLSFRIMDRCKHYMIDQVNLFSCFIFFYFFVCVCVFFVNNFFFNFSKSFRLWMESTWWWATGLWRIT